MHLDNDSVCTRRQGRTRHRRDAITNPGAVTWIGNDRKVRHPMHRWDRSQVEHVSCCRVKCANAALTQDDLLVSFRQNVFCAQQKISNRRCHSALEEHWLSDATNCLE